MAKWLVKTEASLYSVDQLAADGVTQWDGVRNYQARNFLRQMKRGEKVLIYHSVDKPTGIVGIAEVAKTAYPDRLQFERSSGYYDEKSSAESPRWFAPDIKLLKRFNKIIDLKEIRRDVRLKNMWLLRPGSRLSVQPVQESEFSAILEIARRRNKQ
ncbi:MAG: EVE domain-containing protein [Deltaproteobacteria bacterium]|nr:EVE domain-containing protein [Deltaproteobacteria bacterium]